MRKLAQYSKLVFFPNTPETFSRVVIEAKMMGLEIISNDLIGALREEWNTLNGNELAEAMKNKKRGLVDLLLK